MQIDIPAADFQRLADCASAAGYADVASYVVALADSVPLPTDLAASVAMLRESDDDLAQGRTIDLQPAITALAAKLGLKLGDEVSR